ncbi:MAG: filamentous hemagglutinin family protein [Terrimicrobiaceae bacterium]|nr:filamentous hemagglutinin family protein [Terrimicrobiaceae bacterium]
MLSVSAQAGGGNAGVVTISTPQGRFDLNGELFGQGGKGGSDGGFSLDVGSLPRTQALDELLNAAGFTDSRTIRVRTGDVLVSGTATAQTFNLSADAGAITVSGLIDASGQRGGKINLSAFRSVILLDGSKLTVAAKEFDAAGKGGAISLEAGAEINGAFDTGALLDVRSGSLIDLTVAANQPASAGLGQFTGTLHLRAPQTAGNSDVQIAPIDGTIKGASSIVVEGYKLFDLTASGGVITSAIQSAVKSNGVTFIGGLGTPTTAGAPSAGYVAMHDRLLANNAGLDSVLSIRPGAEIINRTGDLTLGTSNSNGNADWNLDTFRFGPQIVPGVLTLRAAGDLIFFNALQDGFDIATKTEAYTAPLMATNPFLPMNAQSWSYRLTAGADLAAADFHRFKPLDQLGADKGSLRLGKNAGKNIATPSTLAGGTTKNAIGLNGRFYQVIRTGSGDIDISAGRDVQILNQFATIYTAGTLISDPTMNGQFELPFLDAGAGLVALGAAQQDPLYPIQYTLGGGNVSIAAQGNISHLTRNTAGVLIPDSERQLPMNWLYRRGFVDPATGEFGTTTVEGVTTISSTTWWVDFSNFFEGVGALGGGNVSLTAGRNVVNVDAVAPTNARMPKGQPDAAKLVELGGGDLLVRAGNDIDGGVYYVERGHGNLEAGNSIHTNATRSPSRLSLASEDPLPEPTWLPTTLFLGTGSFDVSARSDVTLGPVANPFLLPGGINNTFWYKTYFSTYAPSDAVNVTSLGGMVTLRQSAALPNSLGSNSLLQLWLQNVLNQSNTHSVSLFQPWLRLNETNVDFFATVASLLPGTLRVTAFGSDINLAGDLTLSPSPRGTVDLVAAGSINGLQLVGVYTANQPALNVWGAGRIDLSDASPAALPSVASPYAYQAVVGNVPGARNSGRNVLAFVDNLFQESGSVNGVLQTKQALHGKQLLHENDPQPVHLYAQGGDISGLTLFAPKAARIVAGHDITDFSFYVQNISAADVTVVSARRDIVAYDANSPLRGAAQSDGNILGNGELPLSGDIQIGGPGSLEVLAGRNLDLGTGPNVVANPDPLIDPAAFAFATAVATDTANGIGVGIASIGNARNPNLPFDGAAIITGAGIGPSAGLAESKLDFDKFISEFVLGDSGARYLSELPTAPDSKQKLTVADFAALSSDAQRRIALQVFYLALRDAGRDHNVAGSPGFGNYTAGFDAIDSLFGKGRHRGDITTRTRNIRTKAGGDISLFAPGGGLTLASVISGSLQVPPGVVTEAGGNISIFTNKNVDIGVGRIFTLRGGNEIIWSSTGDIAAGSSSKTVASAPPTRVLIDPQSADLKTDLAGLSTGGGIGVLATVEGVPPGDVDLIAPGGVVDAGDAGIRVSGNLNIAAVAVLNASNINVAGTSAGVPAPAPVSAPNIAGLTSASNTAGAANSAANDVANQARQQAPPEETPSNITVEVIGYGNDDSANADASGNGGA